MSFIEVKGKKEASLIGLAKGLLARPLGELIERFNAEKGSVSSPVIITGELAEIFDLSPDACVWTGIGLGPRDTGNPSPWITIKDGEEASPSSGQVGRYGGARVSELLQEPKKAPGKIKPIF